MNDNKTTCITLYNDHITTHVANEAGRAASEGREIPVIRPKIKAGISIMDWEAFELSFKLFKATTDI